MIVSHPKVLDKKDAAAGCFCTKRPKASFSQLLVAIGLGVDHLLLPTMAYQKQNRKLSFFLKDQAP